MGKQSELLARLAGLEKLLATKLGGPDAEAEDPTVDELWDPWFATLEGRPSGAGIKGYRKYLAIDCKVGNVKFRLGDLKCSEITTAHLAAWMTALASPQTNRGRGLKVNTRNLIRTYIQSCFSYNVKEGRIPKNPLQRFPREYGRNIKTQGAFSPDKAEIFLKACHPKLAAMMLTSGRCGGMRRDEVRLLQVTQIDHETREFVLPNLKKNGEFKRVYITKDVYPIVKAYAATAPGKYVWWSDRNPLRPVSTSWVHNQTVKARRKTGIMLGGEQPTMRHWRHTFTRNSIVKGIPLSLIAEQLGHTDASMLLDVYGQIKAKDAQRILRDGMDAPTPQGPSYCPSVSPKSGMSCELGAGHSGPHRAAILEYDEPTGRAVKWGKKSKPALTVVSAQKNRIGAKPAIPKASFDRHLDDNETA